MIKIKTEYPVAFDSIDHIKPHGTANDNYTNIEFIKEVEDFFYGRKINYMDLGCAGGQLAIDFFNRGHFAIGLEGSDFSLIRKRANWENHSNTTLFTCDISRPFEILGDNDNRVLFDCITANEVLEHIPRERLNVLMENIYNHLKDDGIFIGSVSITTEPWHVSVFSKEIWYEEIFKPLFTVESYPFNNKVRADESTSFYIKLRKK